METVVFTLAVIILVTVAIIGMLVIEAADIRADLKASIEETEMLFEQASKLIKIQTKLAAIGRHPATGDIGEKILKTITETHQN